MEVSLGVLSSSFVESNKRLSWPIFLKKNYLKGEIFGLVIFILTSQGTLTKHIKLLETSGDAVFYDWTKNVSLFILSSIASLSGFLQL